MSFNLINYLLGIINFIAFLFSIPILVDLVEQERSNGLTIDTTLISIRFLIMIVSLEGFIGSCCRVTWLNRAVNRQTSVDLHTGARLTGQRRREFIVILIASLDNDPKVLCFNCQSCKAGVADNMKHTWERGHCQSCVRYSPLRRILYWLVCFQKQLETKRMRMRNVNILHRRG